MYILILILHVTACVSLIMIVLLQAGKGGGIAGLFGGGGSDQLFSAPSGLAFIKKVTVAMAVVFMVTSLFLTIMSSRRELTTVTRNIPIAPVVPPTAPPQ